MNNLAGLLHTYDAGSQQWFERKKFFSQDGRLRRYGCGVIAAVDYCIYRGIEPAADSRQSYLSVVRRMEKPYLRVVPGFGLSAVLYPVSMNFLLRRSGAKERMRGVSFFFLTKRSLQRLLTLIQTQLQADCPVILILGSVPFWNKKRGGVTFCRLTDGCMKPAMTHVAAHFITVTGMCKMPDEQIFLELYSWGEKYYLSPEEYLRAGRYTYPFSNRVYRTKL